MRAQRRREAHIAAIEHGAPHYNAALGIDEALERDGERIDAWRAQRRQCAVDESGEGRTHFVRTAPAQNKIFDHGGAQAALCIGKGEFRARIAHAKARNGAGVGGKVEAHRRPAADIAHGQGLGRDFVVCDLAQHAARGKSGRGRRHRRRAQPQLARQIGARGRPELAQMAKHQAFGPQTRRIFFVSRTKLDHFLPITRNFCNFLTRFS